MKLTVFSRVIFKKRNQNDYSSILVFIIVITVVFIITAITFVLLLLVEYISAT